MIRECQFLNNTGRILGLWLVVSTGCFFSEKDWLIVDCSVMQTPNSAQNPLFTLLSLIVALAYIELKLVIHRSVDIDSETEWDLIIPSTSIYNLFFLYVFSFAFKNPTSPPNFGCFSSGSQPTQVMDAFRDRGARYTAILRQINTKVERTLEFSIPEKGLNHGETMGTPPWLEGFSNSFLMELGPGNRELRAQCELPSEVAWRNKFPASLVRECARNDDNSGFGWWNIIASPNSDVNQPMHDICISWNLLEYSYRCQIWFCLPSVGVTQFHLSYIFLDDYTDRQAWLLVHI